MARKQNWKLWLDDIRFPPPDDMSWRIARNYDDACWLVKSYGIPISMSLDHDLGLSAYAGQLIGNDKNPETGYDFAKWFCEYVQENNIKMPRGFDYYSHSQNPIGKINIITYMGNFVKKVWKNM